MYSTACISDIQSSTTMRRKRDNITKILKKLASVGICLISIQTIVVLFHERQLNQTEKENDERGNRLKAYTDAVDEDVLDVYHVNTPKEEVQKIQSLRMTTPSNYEDLVQLNIDMEIPKHLNIVMMADSLTRYQYLSLVYFLSYGNWVQNNDRPNIVLEKTHQSWTDFYNYTNEILQPYELCDCYRGEGKPFKGKIIDETVENRYFYDPIRNNSVTYLQKFGTNSFHSNWNVKEIKALREKNHRPKQILDAKDMNYVVDTAKWSNIIDNYICQLEPKPSLFIFNQGLWGRSGFDDVKIRREIIISLNKCGIQSMYKTTTKSAADNTTTVDDYEKDMCAMSDYCYDMSWTGMIPTEMYWDRAHFLPICYTWMNVLLLNLLSSVQNKP